MNKNEWKKWVSVVGRMLLAFALVFARGAWAGQNQATKDKAGSPQKAGAQQASEKQSAAVTTPVAQSKQSQGEQSEGVAGERPSRDGSHQGIKVHGHWTIEVRNPDGTLATHREFENSLAASGNTLLSQILGRQISIGLWSVELAGPGGTGIGGAGYPCTGPSGINFPCLIAEPNFGLSGSCISNPNCTQPAYLFDTLTVAVNNNSLVLSGYATTAGGSVNFVATHIVECASNTVPGCNTDSSNAVAVSGGGTIITSAAITPAISVQAGQTVAVTVVISFS